MVSLSNRCARFLRCVDFVRRLREAIDALRGEREYLRDVIIERTTNGEDGVEPRIISSDTFEAVVDNRYVVKVRYGDSIQRRSGLDVEDQAWLEGLRRTTFQDVSFRPYVRIRYELNRERIRQDFEREGAVLREEHLVALGVEYRPTMNLSVSGIPTNGDAEAALAETEEFLEE